MQEKHLSNNSQQRKMKSRTNNQMDFFCGDIRQQEQQKKHQHQQQQQEEEEIMTTVPAAAAVSCYNDDDAKNGTRSFYHQGPPTIRTAHRSSRSLSPSACNKNFTVFYCTTTASTSISSHLHAFPTTREKQRQEEEEEQTEKEENNVKECCYNESGSRIQRSQSDTSYCSTASIGVTSISQMSGISICSSTANSSIGSSIRRHTNNEKKEKRCCRHQQDRPENISAHTSDRLGTPSPFLLRQDTSSTQPISLPKCKVSYAEKEEEIMCMLEQRTEYYNACTWQMYHRITKSRSRKNNKSSITTSSPKQPTPKEPGEVYSRDEIRPRQSSLVAIETFHERQHGVKEALDGNVLLGPINWNEDEKVYNSDKEDIFKLDL